MTPRERLVSKLVAASMLVLCAVPFAPGFTTCDVPDIARAGAVVLGRVNLGPEILMIAASPEQIVLVAAGPSAFFPAPDIAPTGPLGPGRSTEQPDRSSVLRI